VEFEWDAFKADDNHSKHGVSFDEAAEVFDDPLVRYQPDDLHSEEEERFYAIGLSASFRLLVVSYTMRGDVVRIIGARLAESRERRHYEAAQDE